jgi:hypothetical protein
MMTTVRGQEYRTKEKVEDQECKTTVGVYRKSSYK